MLSMLDIVLNSQSEGRHRSRRRRRRTYRRENVWMTGPVLECVDCGPKSEWD